MYRLVSFCFKGVAGLLISTAAFAQSSSTTVTAPLPDSAKPAEKKYSLVAIISASTNLEESGGAQDSTGGSIEVKPSMRISSKSSLVVTLAGELDQKTGNSKILNTQVLVARDPIQLTNDDALSLAAQVILPTDEDARDASLRGSAGAIAGISHKFAMLGKPSAVTYAANGLKNSHEYTRNENREANISYRLRHIVGLEVGLSKKVSLDVSGYYQIGYTYHNVAREAYNSSQSIVYALNDQFAVSLDHTTEGKLFAADGSDWNAKLYDSRHSEVGVSLKGSF